MILNITSYEISMILSIVERELKYYKEHNYEGSCSSDIKCLTSIKNKIDEEIKSNRDKLK